MEKKGIGVTKTTTIIILVAVLVVAAIGGVAYYYLMWSSAPSEVVVGVVMPVTGGYAYLGDICWKGMSLAAEKINEGGGIRSLGGAKLKLVLYDAGASAAEATSALQRLLSLYSVSAVIMPWPSGYVLAASEICERDKIPLLCTAWADSITARGFSYVFRFCPNSSTINSVAIPALLDLGKNATGRDLTKICFLYDDNPATIGLIDSLKTIAINLNLTIVLDEMWSPPLRDATPLVLKVKDADPEIFLSYAININDVFLLVSKLKEMLPNLPLVFYGGGILNPQFVETMGTVLSNRILAISDWNVMKGQESIENAYMTKYNVRFMPKDAGLVYGVVMALKEALEIAGSMDPQKVRDALASMDITTGEAADVMWGRVKFKSNGDIVSAYPVIVQWQNGLCKTVWPIDKATAEVIWPTS